MKIISWNLLYRAGAAAAEIGALIEREKPDLFLMQEATQSIHRLPKLVGGKFYELPWNGKSYSLAAWAPNDDLSMSALDLPYSNLPGKFPPRVAQLLTFEGMSVANVHLSHGQLLNRRQLRTIADAVSGPLAIIGDFNLLGRVVMRGFDDVGPRQTTHMAKRMMPLRLDRCLVRGLDCVEVDTFDRGRSDHRPIMLRLEKSGPQRVGYTSLQISES